MQLTFLGHACFLLDDGTHKVLIDPHLSGNPLAAAKAEEVIVSASAISENFIEEKAFPIMVLG